MPDLPEPHGALACYASHPAHKPFAACLADPGQLRSEFAARADPERAVADDIAGMTNRFALHEYERLTGRRLEPC